MDREQRKKYMYIVSNCAALFVIDTHVSKHIPNNQAQISVREKYDGGTDVAS